MNGKGALKYARGDKYEGILIIINKNIIYNVINNYFYCF
jgi:hypothetical protein